MALKNAPPWSHSFAVTPWGIGCNPPKPPQGLGILKFLSLYLGYSQVQISKELIITPSGVSRLCRSGEEIFRENGGTVEEILK